MHRSHPMRIPQRQGTLDATDSDAVVATAITIAAIAITTTSKVMDQ